MKASCAVLLLVCAITRAATPDAIVLASGNGEVARYQANPALPDGVDETFRRGGYLHPVRTPDGRTVTGDFPTDHRHHHGIWFVWTKTTFDGRHPDFWNMGEKTGRVDVVGIDEAGEAGFRSRHRIVDLTSGSAISVLDETWTVDLVSASPDANIFDLEITQTPSGDRPLELLEHHYGGLGFRGPDNWTGDNFAVLTSEGVTARTRANESRARWIRISGDVDGRPASITILGHPDNFRAPQPLRVHPDEPFVCFAPPQLGDFAIEPGETFTCRYRFLVSDDPPSPAKIEEAWRDFAQ